MTLIDQRRREVAELHNLGHAPVVIAAKLRIPTARVESILDKVLDELEMDAIIGRPVQAERQPAEPEPKKRCPRCDQVKPVSQFGFRSGDRSGEPAGWCRQCDAHKPRRQTPNRLIRTRAFHRARARLVQAHRQEFEDLLATELDYARAEADGLMSRAESEGLDVAEPPRLRPGIGPADADPAIPRIDTQWCSACNDYHDDGHRCPACQRHDGAA